MPPTRRDHLVEVLHGRPVADPYRWLEDAEAEDTRAWISAQNECTRTWLERAPSREAIRERLTQLWDFPRRSAPFRRGQVWFQQRNDGLQNQPVLYVMSSPTDEGRPLLDPNTIREDGTAALTGVDVTCDGRLLAYGISEAGSDWITWRVRDVATGEDLPDTIRWSKFSAAAWTRDGTSFFYNRLEAPEEGAAHSAVSAAPEVREHRLGDDPEHDQIVFHRPDQPEWLPHPAVTHDGRWLVITTSRGTRRETRVDVLDLDDRVAGVRALVDDFESKNDVVGSLGERLLVVTDWQAPRGRVVAIDVADPRRERWVEVVPESEDTLEGATLAGGRLVLSYLHHAHQRLVVHEVDGAFVREIDVPVIGTAAVTGHPDQPELMVTFSGFTDPGSILHHDLDTGRTEALWRPQLDLDPDRFVTEQVFATSLDGTRVPMFLVRRRDVEPTGEVPTLLYGYGGFNIPVTPAFRLAHAVWVERGGVLAVANLRGGGEYGRGWYEAGRLENKPNVFEDAAACARWLIDRGWTRPERLAVQGGSNGGLLVGALLVRFPELFGAAVPEVGVLDLLRFHRFTIGWAWTSDFGDPDDPDDFPWIAAMSPYHNLAEGAAYPATMVVTGDHDDRVHPGHSFKFAAALQHAQGGDAPVLIRVEPSAGHGMGKPTAKLIAERTDVLTFLEHVLSTSGRSDGP